MYHSGATSSKSSANLGDADFAVPHSSYSAIVFNPPPSDHSVLTTKTTDSAASAAASRKVPAGPAAHDLSFLMKEHQDLNNRHRSCLLQLQKIFNEAETLRQENTNLRVANCDLNNRLSRLVDVCLQNRYASMMVATTSAGSSALSPEYATAPISSITEKFGGLRASREGCESPTSVIESDRAERDVDRVSLPKSISVRSTGFLKAGSNATTTAPNRGINQSRPPTDGPQKVYVRGGNKKDGPIELEVHNQGMFKTELCNKWQETGLCPYGEHCQFAHGIEELRPVLRHPRYKTEVCRMVLAGDHCPYGHRCHFRHSLTEQEKPIVPLKLD
ncbi:hypothetical protein V2J09_003552 [Rumex salicifolius]